MAKSLDFRKLAAVAMAIATSAASRDARAQTTRPRVVVVVQGAGADAARDEVRAAAPEGVTLVSGADFVAAWEREGGTGAPALPPRRNLGARSRAEALTKLRRAARVAHADAVVIVTAATPVRGGARAARVVVVVTAEDEPRVDEAITLGARAPSGALRRALDKGVRDLEASARADRTDAALTTVPAGAPSPAARDASPMPAALALSSSAPSSSPSPVDRDGPPPPPGASDASLGHTLFDVAAGVELGARDFRYTSRLTNNLRDYSLAATPLFAISGAVYPFAISRESSPVDFGVVASFTKALSVSSATSSGSNVATRWSRFAVGPRLRMRLDALDGVVLGASGAYGEESFTFDDASPDLDTQLPSVTYRFVRPAVDARLQFGRVAAFAGAGYLAILSGGAVGDRFPSASIGGIEASVGGAFAIAGGFEVRALVDYRRYFYALNPTPGTSHVAGGALDQMAGAQIALAFAR